MRVLLLALSTVWLCAGTSTAQEFTIEINRGQADDLTLSVAKTSPNGLALTWVFERHNVTLVDAGESPLADEPTYLRDQVLLPALRSWRRQQLDEGVDAAFDAANEATKASVRSLLGL